MNDIFRFISNHAPSLQPSDITSRVNSSRLLGVARTFFFPVIDLE